MKMLTQLLAMLVAFGLTYCLLRLRHFILACGKDKRKYYRAYIVGFDETDKRFGKDDHSDGKPSADGAISEWPTELEIQFGPSTQIQEKSDVYDTVAAGAPATILPQK
jgi:hypothetical protein